MKELEELIKLARQVAKPYFVLSCILAFLLLISMGGNIYQMTLTCDIEIEQIIDNDSDNNSMEGING